ncbi:MAG: hypothetical protein HYT11_01175 [Candidatus Levybacteria bacterium]|nr:hypothetical protein [Candidatus Levybacteria bacterium]
MASKVEMGLARNFNKDFFVQRNLPLDIHDRPVFKAPGPIEGSSIEQPFDGTVVIYRESKSAASRAVKTIYVFPKDEASISWVVVQNRGGFHFERRSADDRSIPEKIRIASQWAADVQQAHKAGAYSSKML